MCIEAQCLELRQRYPYLFLEKRGDEYFIRGTIFIEKDDIKDRYEVEIQINCDYPKKVPTVRETGSKIAETFHHNPDGSLCLEAPLAVYEVFRANETLINFVDNLLAPYLYGHSHYLKHGKLPFGEHAHGAEGILEDYKKRFEITEDSSVLRLIQILAENTYRGHHVCPCGSKKKLRDCHGKYLLWLNKIQFNFMKDYLEILGWLKKTKSFNVIPFLSEKARGVLDQIKANPNHKWGY
jgi:hypothetical protein